MATSNSDICDLLEDIASTLTTTTVMDHQDMIQLATCPRAHASVQGMVERQFHPLHLRDFYSVINYLLLRYSTLAQDKQEDQIMLKKQISELQQKNRERKSKYEELYRINQQWSADYKDLQRQLHSPSSAHGEDRNFPSSARGENRNSEECSKCVINEREIEEKKGLIIDLNATLEKLQVKDKDWSVQLKDKEDTIQDLLNECSALRYQFQEIGGLAAALRLKDDKKELTKQIHKLKERNTDLERDRAQLQTQFNRFRQSVRQILFDSASSDHTQYHTTPPTYNDVRIPPGMASKGYIYPKQFAPRNSPAPYKTSHDITRSKQPPTPPGLISRSINGTSSHYFEPHPHKPNTLTEQVIGRPHPQVPRLLTSSQFLEPNPPTQLLSPGSTPRPMSAPGSLLVNESERNFSNQFDHTHIKPTRPSDLNLKDCYYDNEVTPPTHFHCPQCNTSFPRQPESCDALLDHLTTCTY